MNSLLDLVNYDNPRSFGSRLRRRRAAGVKVLIEAIFAERGSVRIIDLGGRRDYWRVFDADFLRDNNVHITLLNSEVTQLPSGSELGFASIAGDACDLFDHADNAFDLVHSNSTVEHVGDWVRMEAFAREVERLAPRHFIQTPYFWFFIEPHFLTPFFHFLPEGLRAKMLMANMVPHKGRELNIGDAMRSVQGARLLDKAQMSFLFPNSSVAFEWFGPLPKSIIATRSSLK